MRYLDDINCKKKERKKNWEPRRDVVGIWNKPNNEKLGTLISFTYNGSQSWLLSNYLETLGQILGYVMYSFSDREEKIVWIKETELTRFSGG